MLKWLINQTKFPEIKSVEKELHKAGILRILLSFIILVRFAEIFYSAYIYNLSSSTILYEAVIFFIILLSFSIGLFTPIATVALIISIEYFDNLFHTPNLGSNVVINLLIILLLMNHGLSFSLDSYLIKSKNKISSLLIKLYEFIGKPTDESIRMAYFFGFIFYALTSFGAILLHLNDPYWQTGLTVQSMLSSSYLFKFYDTFRILESSYPTSVYMLSIIGGFIQSVFQLFMLPLIFFTWGRKFIIVWGLIFFFISLIGINLSYLPYIEIIYWLLIFFVINPDSNAIKILYDDHCNLCKKGMKIFQFINFNGKYIFIPLSKNTSMGEAHGLTEKEIQTYMVGFLDNKCYIGYNLYLVLFKANPLLWIFLPLMYFGLLFNIGNRIYSFIAERRYQFFGKCQLSSANALEDISALTFLDFKLGILNKLHILMIIVCIAFVAFKFPYISKWSKNISSNQDLMNVQTLINNGTSYLGFNIPNVFNKTDLSMGDRWLVLYRYTHGKWNLVPLTGRDGNRLNYQNFDIMNFSNHNSDFLYFGCTLKYQRHQLRVQEKDLHDFHTTGYGFKNILKRVKYDYRFNHFKKHAVYYKIKVFSNTSSVVVPWISNSNRHIEKNIYNAMYIFDGKNLTKITE